MKLRSRLGILLVAAVVAASITTLVAEVSLNPYTDAAGTKLDHPYHWNYAGGPYMVCQWHPDWPEQGIPSEWRLNPLGIVLSIGFWIVLLGGAWLVLLRVRRVRDAESGPTSSVPA